MRKRLLIFLLIVLVLPSAVFAQTDLETTQAGDTTTTTSPSTGTAGTAPGTRGSVSEQVRQTQETQMQKKTDHARELFARLTRRLNAAVERLEIMGERINARLIILSNRGVEVSALQDDLIQAKEILASVKTKIQSLNADFEEALVSQNPKLAFETVRQSVSSIKTDLTTVLKTYAQIVRQMKGLSSVQTEKSATESATVE